MENQTTERGSYHVYVIRRLGKAYLHFKSNYHTMPDRFKCCNPYYLGWMDTDLKGIQENKPIMIEWLNKRLSENFTQVTYIF